MQVLTQIPIKNLQKKAQNLYNILQSLPAPFYIACSGGLDSRFLAFFAQKMHLDFTLLHVIGDHTDIKENNYLQTWAKNNNLSLKIFPISIFDIKAIAYNHKDRCYFCKKKTFEIMLAHINNASLCDGSHTDDKNTYRPGMRALHELNIHSPLAMANFSKNDIKQLATFIQLENPHQKAKPCLLTRFPYNTKIEKEKIQQILEYETICEEFFLQNLSTTFDFRIRNIDNKLCLHYTTPLEETLINKLQTTLIKANLTPIPLTQLSVLSGYFDN